MGKICKFIDKRGKPGIIRLIRKGSEGKSSPFIRVKESRHMVRIRYGGLGEEHPGAADRKRKQVGSDAAGALQLETILD